MSKRDFEREERFSKLVAIDGLNFTEAWCESAEYQKPEASAAARVQASRMAKRTEQRRAELLQAKADATKPVEVSTDPQSILHLMDEVSSALMDASKAAAAHGHSRLSNNIKQSLTTHVGRQNRISQRVARPDVPAPADGEAQKLARKILSLKYE